MIAAKATAQDIVRAAREKGELKTLKEDAADKILAGVTSMEEAMSEVMT